VRAKTFNTYALHSGAPDLTDLSKTDAIDSIMTSLAPDSIVVGSTGHISREIYALSLERNEDVTREFLTVGSMGHASQIALGVALKKPNRQVYCIDGDGASLMHLGNTAIVGQSGCKNYRHVLLNNAAHDSVGGQPTIGGDIDWKSIATACGYRFAISASSLDEVGSALENIEKIEGPTMLEIRIKKGARADLPRPKETPQESKANFMSFTQNPNQGKHALKTD
jgi:phosphonopyruvate decarboxylase